MTSITVEATKPLGVKPRDAERSKNFFALGLICWMYDRPDRAADRLDQDALRRAAPRCSRRTRAAFRAGFNFGETAELFDHPYEIKPAQLAAGHVPQHHRQRRAVVRARRRGAAGEAADLLRVVPDHARVRHPARALEAEELRREDAAGRGRDRGRGRRDRRRVRGQPRRSPRTSGPGVDLKSEAIGLAISLELPLVLVDVQRGGPSTGLPTKTEQADLMLAMYGRHGEAPLPIVAAQSPADCFDAAFEAVRIALKYRTPVILLTDGYLANGAEPWNLPDLDALPDISVPFATEPNHGDEFWPYLRDPETLARPWAIPGTPGPDAPRRRPREGRRHRQRQLRPREPRQDDAHPRREDRRHRQRHPARRPRRPGRRRVPRAEWGGTWGAAKRGGAPGPRPRAQDRARAPAPHEPVPAPTSATSCAATRRSSCPRSTSASCRG